MLRKKSRYCIPSNRFGRINGPMSIQFTMPTQTFTENVC
ncbi:unnamed protein product [Acanthoscelides obtectus]|uniref:Uncharacterized protein n=1 Tax=Acanthoscelides obtectus TaxID=200917 RepID=A0A9P0KS42_ACAOB|nr:unnamed protein product [Acanthoscelides obtectus]CAK1675584.1 hypothetical protein AOBTE_LOCUS30308 [Acanthoscelides obtectus]